jgi:glucose-6-phosphate-specific signal transduction histidine kinase
VKRSGSVRRILRDVTHILLGPWPLATPVLLVGSAVFFNYVVAEPYGGSGSPIGSHVATAPASVLNAAAFALPVWVSNRVHARMGWALTRLGYLMTVVIASAVMAVVRVPVLQWSGFDTPFTIETIAGITLRGTFLALITFTLVGIYSARLREQTRRATHALAIVEEQSRTLIETEERVRASVRQFLHDRVQASLVALGMQLSFLSRQTDDLVREQIGSLVEEVERIRTEDVRVAARLLSPDIAAFGIVACLRDLGGEYGRNLSVTVESDVDVTQSAVLSRSPAGLAIYRVVEQALVNSVVHGRARNATIRIYGEGGEVCVTVTDDGLGVPVGPMSRGTGSLLMDAWTDSVGGSWSLRAASPGAVLVMTVPNPVDTITSS